MMDRDPYRLLRFDYAARVVTMNLKKAIAAVAIVVTSLTACTPQEIALLTQQTSTQTISIKQKINSAVYTLDNPTPARAAYRAVAKARHWTDASIRNWEPFIMAVVQRESHYCPNVKRGAIATTKGAVGGCVLKVQGTHSDSGFGQVIGINYTSTAPLCVIDRLCSSQAIIGTPWNSMTALVALVERNGRHPWCYTYSLRAGRVCQLAPAGKPYLTQ